MNCSAPPLGVNLVLALGAKQLTHGAPVWCWITRQRRGGSTQERAHQAHLFQNIIHASFLEQAKELCLGCK